jgi:hypothetical protein
MEEGSNFSKVRPTIAVLSAVGLRVELQGALVREREGESASLEVDVQLSVLAREFSALRFFEFFLADTSTIYRQAGMDDHRYERLMAGLFGLTGAGTFGGLVQLATVMGHRLAIVDGAVPALSRPAHWPATVPNMFRPDAWEGRRARVGQWERANPGLRLWGD